MASPSKRGEKVLLFVFLLYSISPQNTREKSFFKVGMYTCNFPQKRVHCSHQHIAFNTKEAVWIMKKFFCGIVKFLAVLAVLGAVVYAVVAYLDKLMELV